MQTPRFVTNNSCLCKLQGFVTNNPLPIDRKLRGLLQTTGYTSQTTGFVTNNGCLSQTTEFCHKQQQTMGVCHKQQQTTGFCHKQQQTTGFCHEQKTMGVCHKQQQTMGVCHKQQPPIANVHWRLPKTTTCLWQSWDSEQTITIITDH